VNLVTLISTLAPIAAVLTLFWFVLEWVLKQRAIETREWQEVVVLGFLSSRGKSGSSLQEILQFYRTEAQARPKPIARKELSEQSLRRIILSLLQKRVVEQISGDHFRVNLVDLGMEQVQELMRSGVSQMIGVQGHMVNDVNAKQAVYSILGSAPFAHTQNDLVMKILEEYDIPSAVSRPFIATELARGRLKLDGKGMIGFGDMARGD
jgi:hypothetical protein